MKVYLPAGLLDFSREFSSFKTPDERTQGWDELPHETRGEGDHLDTVGSLMLWRHLAKHGLPVTYHLTAGEGDEADLRVSRGKTSVDINVKTSKYDGWSGDPEAHDHNIFVKQVELEKELPDVYSQVFVHLADRSDEPHVHLCGWIATGSDAFKSEPDNRPLRGTSGSQYGMEIHSDKHRPLSSLVSALGA